jgi:hypothetical protein
MIEVLLVIGFLTLIAAAALFGTDSRDGRDWQPRDCRLGPGAPHH